MKSQLLFSTFLTTKETSYSLKFLLISLCWRHTHKGVLLLLIMSSGLSGTLLAQPYLSTDDLPPCFEIDARARNGNTGFEGVLFTPSTPAPGQPGGGEWQMNPSGAPIWNSNGNVYGDIHSFQLIYTKATGNTEWKIDFNRDGDYADPQEIVTNVAPTLAGKGFKYVNIYVQGNASGLAANVSDFTINGENFGSFSSSSDTPLNTLFEETLGLFDDVIITGNFSFTGDGGQERPRIWVRMGTTNEAPICLITDPADGSIFNVTDNIVIEADATDDGIIMVVEFFAGSTKIGEDSISPYNFTWVGAAPGTYVLTAKATDSYDAFTISAPVTIIVNAPPTCSITNPSNGFVLFEPDSIVIEAIAADTDDSVVVVAFYVDTVKVGEDSIAPYSITLYSPLPAIYALTAKAIDSRNGMMVSALVTGIVNAPPTCVITSPFDGEIFFDPVTIPFQVLATDATDGVAEVEFFLNMVSIGVDNLAPFENLSLLDTPMGMYTLLAKSTDIYGVSTFSSPVNITVRCIREDIDLNGIVNTTDFLLFISSYGIQCNGCNADFNDDGEVNTIDFLRLLSKIGYTCN